MAVSTILKQADLLALKTTRVKLIDAPGEGNVIVPVTIMHRSFFETTPYQVGRAALNYFLGDFCLFPNESIPLYLLAATEDKFVLSMTKLTDTNGISVGANQPLFVSNVGQDDLTGGDGSLEINIPSWIVWNFATGKLTTME